MIRADMNGDGSVDSSRTFGCRSSRLYLYPGNSLIHLIANTRRRQVLRSRHSPTGGESALGVSVDRFWLCVADIFVRLFLPEIQRRIRIMSEIVEDLAKRAAARRARPWYLRHLIPLYSCCALIAIIAVAVFFLFPEIASRPLRTPPSGKMDAIS